MCSAMGHVVVSVFSSCLHAGKFIFVASTQSGKKCICIFVVVKPHEEGRRKAVPLCSMGLSMTEYFLQLGDDLCDLMSHIRPRTVSSTFCIAKACLGTQ